MQGFAKPHAAPAHAPQTPAPPHLKLSNPQVQQGAHVLDINMDDGLIDGMAAMTKFVNLCIAGGFQLRGGGWGACGQEGVAGQEAQR